MFFENIDQLAEADKIKKNIEKATKTLSFKSKAPQIIRQKVNSYENPIDEMVIMTSQKSKYFTKDSDIVLLIITNEVGYGKWKQIKQKLRRDSRCRFDHLLLSRTAQELQRRVDLLIKALEKEEVIMKKREDRNAGEDGEENQRGFSKQKKKPFFITHCNSA